MIIDVQSYINNINSFFPDGFNILKVLHEFPSFVDQWIKTPGEDYRIHDHIAIHKTAIIENNVIIKPPAIIGKNAFIGANNYIRGGVILLDDVRIGTGCEIKSSILFNYAAAAHFNFIGDSIIGSYVNFEAGAVTANHFNERENKNILIKIGEQVVDSQLTKFGALVGDHSKIGANAVLSPGTILPKNSIIKRLELVEQVK